MTLSVECSSLTRDVNSYSKAKSTLEPTITFKGHTSVVGVRMPALFPNVRIDVDIRRRTWTGMRPESTNSPVLETIRCS